MGWAKRIGFVVALLALLAAGLVAMVDWRGRVEAALTATLGRAVTASGGVSVGLLPFPWIELREVRVAGAEFGPETLAEATLVRLSLAVGPLWRGEADLPSAEVDGLRLSLARDGAGRGNWEFSRERARPSGGEGWTPTAVVLRRGAVHLERLSFMARPEGAEEVVEEVAFEAAFAAAGPDRAALFAALTGEVAARAPTLALGGRRLTGAAATAAYVGEGQWRVTMEGVADGASLALRVDLDHPLRALDGEPLVFAAEAKVGEASSHASGALALDLSGAAPALDARVDFGVLDLAALGGAPTPAPRDGRLIPPTPLPRFALPALTATLRLSAGRVVAPGGAVLEAPRGTVTLGDGALALTEFEAGHAGGRISGGGRYAPATGRLSLRLTANGLAATALAASTPALDLGGARVGLDLDLAGAGGDLRALAATLDGRAELRLSGGRLRLTGGRSPVAGLGDVLDPMMGGGGQAVRCALTRWRIDRGVATSLGMVLDSEGLSASGRGTVNLRDESLDLVVAARPFDSALLPLAAVFRVGGTLAAPRAALAPETLLTSAGALAGAAARVNPLGAIAALAVAHAANDRAPGCAAALERAESLPALPLAAIGGAALGAVGDAVGAAGRGAGAAAGAAAGAVGGAARGAAEGLGGAVGGAVEGVGRGLRGLFGN